MHFAFSILFTFNPNRMSKDERKTSWKLAVEILVIVIAMAAVGLFYIKF